MDDVPDEIDEIHTSDEVLAFEFACSRCGETIALMGRVVLTPDRRGGSFSCDRCGNEAYLAIVAPGK